MDVRTQSGPGQAAHFLPMLPREVVRMIVELCGDDTEALASLALVSHGCRALCRTHQFKVTRLDLSGRSQGLVARLLQEAAESAAGVVPSGREADLALRDCVRRIDVGMVNLNLRSAGGLPPLPIEDVEDLRERHEAFVAQLACLLLPGVLPNLEILDTGLRFWQLEQHFLHRVLYSPTIKHLYLRAATPAGSPLLAPPPASTFSRYLAPSPASFLNAASDAPAATTSSSDSTGSAMPRLQPAKLETLELDLSGDTRGGPYCWDVPTFVADMMDLCAPSVQQLRLRRLHGSLFWGGHSVVGQGSGRSRVELPTRRQVPPKFPSLRLLYVDRMAPLGRSFLVPLLEGSPQLRSLVVDISDDEIQRAITEARRPLSSVRDVIWYGGGGTAPTPLADVLNVADLLGPFKRIDGFCIGGSAVVDAKFAVDKVLPVFASPRSSRFGSLNRLSLAFGELGASGQALALIGRILTLERLHLTAATQPTTPDTSIMGHRGAVPPPRGSWLVRHAVVRRHLLQLARLKMLLFGGDDYLLPVVYHPPPCELASRSRYHLGAGRRRYYNHYPPLWPWAGLQPPSPASPPTPSLAARRFPRKKAVRRCFTYRRLTAAYAPLAADGEDDYSNFNLHSWHRRHQRQQQLPPPPWYWNKYQDKGHCCRIMNEADRYANVFPNLCTLYLGGMHLVKSQAKTFMAMRPNPSDPFDPIRMVFDFSPTAESARGGDESALGLDRYPSSASEAYPPLREDSDDSDDEGDGSNSHRPAGSRRGGLPPHVPLRQFFCELCFITSCNNKSSSSSTTTTTTTTTSRSTGRLMMPVLQTQCAHQGPRPSAAWAALEAASHSTAVAAARYSYEAIGGPRPRHPPTNLPHATWAGVDSEAEEEEHTILETVEQDDDSSDEER